MPDPAMPDVPGVLQHLHADWAARGWDPAALDAFRMEGEGDGAAPAGLPDLDAILDGADDTPADPAVPEPVADPAEGANPDPAAPPAGDEPAKTGLDALPEEWQKEVREAREEAKRYRLRAKEYDEVYDGLDDAGRGFLLELNKALKAGDTDAAQAMWDQLFTADPADPDPAAAPPATAMSADDIDRIVEEKLAAREQARQKEQAIADLDHQAEALGYKPGTRDYVNLLFVANHETNGDIAAAAEALKADRQKVIDEFLASKASDSEQHTTPAAPNGSAPSGERPITDLRQAKAGLEEWLASQ